jgi:hypothetical protein
MPPPRQFSAERRGAIEQKGNLHPLSQGYRSWLTYPTPTEYVPSPLAGEG